MTNKTLVSLVLLLLIAALPAKAQQQEVQISQYMFNGLTLNPALAGNHEAFNAQLLYRRQWEGIANAPISYIGSVDGMVTQSNTMGWGLSVVHEEMGLMRTTGAHASYAFRIPLNTLGDRLSLGLSAGAMQQVFRGVDFNAMDNQGRPVYDPDDVLAADNRWKPDFRVGAYYNMGRTFYAGVSASNLGSFLNSSAGTLNSSNPFIYGNLGANLYVGHRWKLTPSTLLTYPLEDRPLVDANLALTYNDRMWIGAGLRTALPSSKHPDTQSLNAVAMMAEVWITHAIRLGYCYDYALGRIGGMQTGSHEISLGITMLREITRIASPRAF